MIRRKDTYYSNEDLVFIRKTRFNLKNGNLIKEQVGGDKDIVPGFPVNQVLKFNEALMVKAIQNGMIILIRYKGDEDIRNSGGERTIYPMVLGVNRNTGNMLLRGWHLNGWSVKERRNAEKVWRLFKTSNIISMMFTGEFYRMAPVGYRMNDRAMTDRIITQADFNVIRRNQEKLLNEGKIELEEEQKTSAEVNRVITIDIRPTDTELDLKNPWANTLMDRRKIDEIKITFMKSVMGSDFIAILGAIGTDNRVTKVYNDKLLIGTYKVLKSTIGRDIEKTRYIGTQTVFKLYLFNKVV